MAENLSEVQEDGIINPINDDITYLGFSLIGTNSIIDSCVIETNQVIHC